jgi:accessory gene regulator protein AgrB
VIFVLILVPKFAPGVTSRNEIVEGKLHDPEARRAPVI